jgi:pectinesterase
MLIRKIRMIFITTAIFTVTGVVMVSTFAGSQQENYGTSTRPLLTSKEAENYTLQKYFSQSGIVDSPTNDPWKPTEINTCVKNPDFVVGSNIGENGTTQTTIQQAVNAAYLKKDLGTRIFIKVLPGTYTEAVYIPKDMPMLTIYGAGCSPSDVNIQLTISALNTPLEYAAIVNPSGQFKSTDPAWSMYDSCASRTTATIGTSCASVFWVQSDNFQLKNVTVKNTLLDSSGNGTAQAVAFRADGDKIQIENSNFIGRQDTLWVNSDSIPSASQQGVSSIRITRAYIKDTYVEGDVDFVMGRANAVFDRCAFKLVSTRKPEGPCIVFAPSTLPNNSYGFLVMNSRFTTDSGFESIKGYLGRSWDQGAGTTGYVPGTSPNGQLVIRDSYIDAGYDLTAPWFSKAATTNRVYAGNIIETRDLNDPNYNRLWEYNNESPQLKEEE